MKQFVFIFFVVISTGAATAQQSTSSKVLYDTLNADKSLNEYFINNAIDAIDAGYVLAGWNLARKDYNYSQIGLLIIKTGEQGSPEWNRVITANGKPDSYQQYGLYRTIPTFDSCYMAVGFMADLSDKRYGVCIKFNMEGDTVWTKVIDGNESIFLYDVSQTIDSGFIISGSVSKPSNMLSGDYLFVAKLNKYGNIEWSKKYSNGSRWNRGYSIKPVDDTNYMISGIDCANSLWNPNSFIAKISASGEVLWAKKYYLEDRDLFIQDFIVNENGIVFKTMTMDALLLSGADSLGAVIWSKKYPYFNRYSDYEFYNCLSCKLHKTCDKGYILLGGDWSGSDLVVTDELGNELFHYVLILNPVDVMETKDNGYFIAGTGPVSDKQKRSWYNINEIGFIKLDSLGVANDFGCSYLMNSQLPVDDTIFFEETAYSEEPYGKLQYFDFTVSSVNILERSGCVESLGAISENLQNSIRIFPNPTTGVFMVSVDAGKTGEFMVYNTLGQMILKQQITTENSTISLNNQNTGVYFYRFVFKNRGASTGKLIISK